MIVKVVKFCRWLYYKIRFASVLQSLPMHTVISPGVFFINSGRQKSVRIGRRVTLCPRVTIETGMNGLITIADNVWISKDVLISANEEIRIGSYSMIGEFTSIRDADHGINSIEIPMQIQPLETAPVLIENDVWIGRGVAILKGVKIGKGSIVGANSVVKNDIPSYSIAVGAPAKVIKKRATCG